MVGIWRSVPHGGSSLGWQGVELWRLLPVHLLPPRPSHSEWFVWGSASPTAVGAITDARPTGVVWPRQQAGWSSETDSPNEWQTPSKQGQEVRMDVSSIQCGPRRLPIWKWMYIHPPLHQLWNEWCSHDCKEAPELVSPQLVHVYRLCTFVPQSLTCLTHCKGCVTRKGG